MRCRLLIECGEQSSEIMEDVERKTFLGSCGASASFRDSLIRGLLSEKA